MNKSYDVAVVGGGLAGVLCARQLRRTVPNAKIALFEKATKKNFKVGESSVEIASNYLTRRLGLSRYMYENMLPKNGLRFFFDTPEKNGELETLSELGSIAMPYLPAFQIDRSRIEQDLLAKNEADGVEVVRGRVSKLALGSGGDHHSFEVETDGRTEQVQARWLVDAAGRTGLIAKRLDLWVDEPHHLSAVWGRFEGVGDLDDVGSPAFGKRVNNTSRFLSTVHFCYPGYWIWFIPLGQGVISVGVVIERSRFDDAWRREEGFWEFLRGHASSAKLLENAKMLDIMSYKQLAYRGKQFFSAPDRWALTGEAGAFSDPFYSPGSDYIALENDYICDLVQRDLGGEGAADLKTRAELYDEYVRFRFETTMKLYQDLYPVLGSYELYRVKWDFDIACYYNLWLEPYLRDEHFDLGYLRSQLRLRKMVNAVMDNFSQLFQQADRHMHETGTFYDGNLGRFQGDFPTMKCAEGLGSDESAKGAIERTHHAFNLTRRRLHVLLGKPEPSDLPLTHYLSGKPIV
jgi:flavin-dependent dehydrogenase